MLNVICRTIEFEKETKTIYTINQCKFCSQYFKHLNQTLPLTIFTTIKTILGLLLVAVSLLNQISLNTHFSFEFFFVL
eukprot:TRINITY_DN2129_c0_g1_i1.p1 TRINITY_DN2129_c0_g1~~TRINITY_DN2129_c0_g1_i1.p1  ORF type:complete len:78 (-),score=16.55 TRINITY_DN2129_c0_g1_i1:243-476(-)